MVTCIKTVGIIIRKFKENKKKFIGTRLDLFSFINKYPINIIAIPITINYNKIINIVKKCDGIILSGGESITQNDLKLVKFLIKNNIPTLGICLGMQSMDNNLTKVKKHYSNKKYVHKIKINKDTLLHEILNKDTITVNSRHHDAIKNTKYIINAKSLDNIIEGIELKNHKFFLGLEWHPESINDLNSKKIINYFINLL